MARLLGITIGFENLPEPIRDSSDVYFNQDLTGDLPQYDTVSNIAARTVNVATQQLDKAGIALINSAFAIPISTG